MEEHVVAQAEHLAALAEAVREVERWGKPRQSAELSCQHARTTLAGLDQRREKLMYDLPRLQRELAKTLAQEAETEQQIDFMIRSSWRAQRYPEEAEYLACQQRAAFRERVRQWERAVAEAELARLEGSTQDLTSVTIAS